MKNKIIKLAGVAITCGVISACSTEFNNPVGDSSSYSSGSADFTSFVSIGDSLTAGYADSSLYLNGQINSYPAILAQQFALVEGGSFNQPLVSDNLGGLLYSANPLPGFGTRLVLDAVLSSPEAIAGTPTTDVLDLQTGAFNNMGVPGAKSYHLAAPNYGDPAGVLVAPPTANPYFARFASSITTTMITDAAAQAPSFFVMWIGNNDVLSYATTGGIGVNQLGNFDPTTYGSNDITDPTAFAGVYAGLVGAFTAANSAAKGVLVNIPDVASIPYFTTVPYNAVPLDQATADTLNTAYAPYNAGIQAALGLLTQAEIDQRTISFTAGQNAVVILDEDLTDLTGVNAALTNMRQATALDLLVLTTSSIIGTEDTPGDSATTWGLGKALEDGHALIPSEIQAINIARLAFNATIQATADANPDLLYFDVAAMMAQLKASGINYGTGFIDSTYATGGGFSLDGVHPTARGYAAVSNEIIKLINSGFNANIPLVDPGAYSTIFVK